MTIQQLKYALVISEAKSFNKAAETIYVSQPSLTAAIHDLEAELGITIFNRTSRGVTLTSEGQDFILNARELLRHWENVLEKYGDDGKRKKKFAISAQHYTFAIKSFVEMAKKINTDEYELAARETKTRDVIEDVASLKSELGVLYLSDFNRKVITNLLESKGLEFNKLIDCVISLNQRIADDESLGEGFCIGHSYFCDIEEIKENTLTDIVEFEIIPLLKEYWFDEPSKVKEWSDRLRSAVK